MLTLRPRAARTVSLSHFGKTGDTQGDGGSHSGASRQVERPPLWIVLPATLVLLTAMKELPATLLLSPTGRDTLAVRVWTAANNAAYGEAAAPALMLVAGTAVPMLLLAPRDRMRELAP